MITQLLTLLLVLTVLGYAVWLVTTYVPMPDPFKRLLIVVIVLVLLFWLVRFLVSGGPVIRGLGL